MRMFIDFLIFPNIYYGIMSWTLISILSFVLLFQWYNNYCDLFNPEAILVEERWQYYSTHRCRNKGVLTIPKFICPKGNVIAWLKFEFSYYDITVQLVSHYS